MLPQYYFLITIIGLLVATYTDLKERMVYNRLTYSLVIIGLVLKAVESFQAQSIEPILLAVESGIIAFIVAYFLWKTGVWAGGDVKLVTGIAILNPINYAVLAEYFSLTAWPFTTMNFPVFPIELIIYSVFVVLPLGVLMGLSVSFKHPEVFAKTKKALIEKGKSLIAISLLIAGITIILKNFAITEFLVLPILIGAALLPKPFRKITTGIISIIGLVLAAEAFVINAITLGIPLLVLYTLWKIYSESKEFAFKEEKKITELEEGMIPDQYIVEKKGKIEFVQGPSIKRVIKNIMNNKIEKVLQDFKIEGRLIANPKRAGGLTENELKELKEKAEKGLMPKTIKVRKTMAFVPAILVAYLILELTGDVLWNIII